MGISCVDYRSIITTERSLGKGAGHAGLRDPLKPDHATMTTVPDDE
tara:strand:+ start:11210 stop:11347 length:138 start_codon:yes stop_codon:yes gene_type:complete